MSIETLIYGRIASLDPVTALVQDRVFLDQLPQSPEYPTVRVQLVSDNTEYHLRGPEALNRSRVQVDCYARSSTGEDPYASASAVMDAIHGDGLGPAASGIHGWIGSLGSPPVDVIAIFAVSRVRRWDPEELQVVTISTDYMVWHRGT